MRRSEVGVSPVIAVILMVAITVLMSTIVFFLINDIIGNEKEIQPHQMGTLGVSSTSDGRAYLVEVRTMPVVTGDLSVTLANWAMVTENGIMVMGTTVDEIYMVDLSYDSDDDGTPDFPVSFQDRDADISGMTKITAGDAFVILKEQYGGLGRDDYDFRLTYDAGGREQLVFNSVVLIS